jgi:hypothetical protein
VQYLTAETYPSQMWVQKVFNINCKFKKKKNQNCFCYIIPHLQYTRATCHQWVCTHKARVHKSRSTKAFMVKPNIFAQFLYFLFFSIQKRAISSHAPNIKIYMTVNVTVCSRNMGAQHWNCFTSPIWHLEFKCGPRIFWKVVDPYLTQGCLEYH